jgi:hypothetical protein
MTAESVSARYKIPARVRLALLALLFLPSVMAGAANAPKLLRSIDLQSEFCPEEFQQYNIPLTGVEFISENQLLVSTVCRIDGISLSKRDRFQATDPYHVKSVILNVSTSAVERKSDWPTHGSGSGLRVTHAGDLLLHRDNILELFSSAGRALQRLQVTRSNADDSTFVWVSPTGDVISVSQGPIGKAKNQALILDSRNLRPLERWQDNADVWNLAASTRAVVRSAAGGKLLVMRAFPSGEWKTIRTETVPSIATPLFIGDLEFAAPVHDAVLLYDIASQRETTLPCSSPIRVAISRDAGTLGVVWMKFADRGGNLNRPNLAGAGVDLYRLDSKRRILSMNVKPSPSYGLDIGISPDGSKLALVDHLRVSLFEIPR